MTLNLVYYKKNLTYLKTKLDIIIKNLLNTIVYFLIRNMGENLFLTKKC